MAVHLDKWSLLDVAGTTIQRRRLEEEPCSEYQGSQFLWPRNEAEKQAFSVVYRRAFYQDPEWRKSKRNDKEFLRMDATDARRFMNEWTSYPRFIVIEDGLPISIAGDFTRPEPGESRTRFGELVHEAKYKQSDRALEDLADESARLVSECELFRHIDHVIPIPPSSVDGGNIVPERVAAAIASEIGAKFSPSLIRTVSDRPSLKGLSLEEKAGALQGSVELSDQLQSGFPSILLVDDHYQSGTTMRFLARALKDANMLVQVYGFACDKTLRNKDNVGGSTGGH